MRKCNMCALKKADFNKCIFSDCPHGLNFINCNGCGDPVFNSIGKTVKCNKCNKRGGKRKGAGRPKKEPTDTVSFRVTLDQVEPVKALVNTYLTNLKNLKSA